MSEPCGACTAAPEQPHTTWCLVPKIRAEALEHVTHVRIDVQDPAPVFDLLVDLRLRTRRAIVEWLREGRPL